MKFSQAPYRLSQLHPAHIDERIVTMRWALGFSRVRHSMAALQNGWATPAGLDELRAKVKRSASMCHRRPWRFGDLGLPAKILDDTCQTNIVGVGRISDPKDDFYGAIGRASLKVAVSGVVTHRPDGTSFITVDELGFYLRDSYEFNDNGSFISQFLGFWGFNGVDTMPQLRGQIQVEDTQSDLTEKELALLKYRVQNSDFDRWRQKHAAGGDFMLVSDVHRHRLPKPLAFQIS
ncbi:hypothetical protein SAMN04489710_10683 [Paracidovorax konjaci]|uniref:Uncharacterized protein n=2 Tax=Paracidovorax konjaci TaxID=32040 RepID=A0A1I1V6X8_9BURK|nr:hypothetical protein SAMN04489710_10683 [Paracidovorax konjaci]